MRLYGRIEKVEPQDDGTVRVHGIASTEDVDDQGDIVAADAMRDALPDYMRFPTIREMHQLSAAGTTIQADVGDDKITRIVTHIVDPVAVTKVKNQVYRGFSIGGTVTQRSGKTITGLKLTEISLVDRPANTEAVFELWKAAQMPEPFNPPIQIWSCGVADHRHIGKADAVKCLEAQSEQDLTEPLTENEATRLQAALDQKSDKTEAETHEIAMKGVPTGDAVSQMAAEIAAELVRIEKDEPVVTDQPALVTDLPATVADPAPETQKASPNKRVTKSLYEVGRIAAIIGELHWIQEDLEWEAAYEEDGSEAPNRLKATIADLCDQLNALVAEETAEILAGDEMGEVMPMDAEYIGGAEVARAAAIAGLKKAAARGVKGAEKMAEILKGNRHSAENQAKLDLAAHCVGKAMEDGSPTEAEKVDLGETHKALLDAGATSHQSTSGVDSATTAAGGDDHATQHTKASDPASIMLDVMLKAAGSTHGFHLAVAHKAMQDASGGQTCKAWMDGKAFPIGDLAKASELPEIIEAAKLAKMSAGDMAHLHKAHFHLTRCAGSMKCDAAKAMTNMGDGDGDDPKLKAATAETQKADEPNDLVKAIAAILAKAMPKPEEKPVEKVMTDPAAEALAKALAPFGDRLEVIAKQVDAIAKQPLPSLTAANTVVPPHLVAIDKGMDATPLDGNQPKMSPEAIAAAWAGMSKEEQTLLMIKGSLASPRDPLRPGGVNGAINASA